MRELAAGMITAAILIWAAGCKHEPIEPIGIGGNDTIQNPIDTSGTVVGTTKPCDPDTVYFNQQILPLLASHCGVPGCHNAASAQKGVILTDYQSIVNTGDVDAGDPTGSKIYKFMSHSDPDKKMPPPSSGITLTQEQINLVYTWILQGAKNNSCDSTNAGNCDTLNMSFSQNILPIISNNCQGCHSSVILSGGVNLSSYAGIKVVADNGFLLGAITHAPGFKPMPFNQPKLNDCNISKIKSWIDAGAPNN